MARCDRPDTALQVWLAYCYVGDGITITDAAEAIGTTVAGLAAAYRTAGLSPGNYAGFIAWIEADPGRSRAWTGILDNQDEPVPVVPPRRVEVIEKTSNA